MTSTRLQIQLGAATEQLRQLLLALPRWLGFLPGLQLMPRKYCHYTRIPLKGIPEKHQAPAIRLRLQQLAIFPQTGFCFQVQNEEAHIWYWDDEQAKLMFAGQRIQPWPEPLWRAPLEQGVRSLRCSEGFELEGINDQQIYRTRWLQNPPTPQEQQDFLRDLGQNQGGDLNTPVLLPRMRRPVAGWRGQSALAPTVPGWLMLFTAALLILILAGTLEGVKIQRLKTELANQKQEKHKLQQATEALAKLEATLQEQTPEIERINQLSEQPRQSVLLAELARKGILGSASDVYLSEWLYRSNSVSATFRLGGKANASELITALEKTGLFSDIGLIPDPPRGMIKLQLQLPQPDDAEPDTEK